MEMNTLSKERKAELTEKERGLKWQRRNVAIFYRKFEIFKQRTMNPPASEANFKSCSARGI